MARAAGYASRFMVAIIAYQLRYTKSLSDSRSHTFRSVFVMCPRKIVAGLNTRVQLLLADMASGLVRELRRPLLRDDKRLGGNKCSLTIKHGWGQGPRGSGHISASMPSTR